MRADRLIALVLLLQARGRMTTGDLAGRLEVSQRTVLRDLDALSAAGVPVYADSGPGGGVSLPDGYRLDLTALNAAEAGALLLSAVPGPLADLDVGQLLEGALRKLSAALPAAAVQEAARARERVHLDPAEWWQTHEPTPHLAVLHDAVWRDRRLRLVYRGRDGRAAELLVDPLGLVAKASVWYLVAADAAGKAAQRPNAAASAAAGGAEARERERGDGAGDSQADGIRAFRVTRLLDARLVDEPAHRPTGFDLARFWSRWCAEFEAGLPRYPITLRVAPEFLHELPQLLGEGVRAAAMEAERAGVPDRRGWLPVPLVFESLKTACVRVLGFGPLVEVESPEELRLRVSAQASRIAAHYAG